MWLYLVALKDDETSLIVPLFQLIPVFSYLFGYFILGETLNIPQILGGVLIISGSFLLSFHPHKNKVAFHRKVFFLMMLSSVFISLSSVIFKAVAIEHDFTGALFWEYIGQMFFGIVLFVFFPEIGRAHV